MQIGKRVLQVFALLGLLGGIYASGAAQTSAGAQEPAETQQSEAEYKTPERYIFAWQTDGGVLSHEVRDGSIVTISDMVATFSGTLPLPERRTEETAEDQDIVPTMGAVYSAATPKLVGIDPGHLGYTVEKYVNTGAESVFGTIEYQWTLEIAQLLSDELIDRGYDVYLLRTTNDLKEFPYNNGQRARAANDMNCDILVAIHWDSSVDEEANGYHTIYKGKKSSASYRLAAAVSDTYGQAVDGAIEKLTNPISRSGLWELNVAVMPAVILECGYSSNREDASWLEDEANYETIVKGIANGIDIYFEGERNSQ